MPEELGKIEKPAVDQFTTGRKLFFVPLVISGKDLPLEYLVKVDHYWDEVETQISNLESKLGAVSQIYQELIPQDGEPGLNILKDLNLGTYTLVKSRVDKGAKFISLEDADLLAELMDWSKCLSVGLQSQKVFSRIYDLYNEASKLRNETIAKKLNESLKGDENAILLMSEGHHVQFPSDIKVFYVAPPSLDAVKRWLRDYEASLKAKESQNPPTPEPAA